MAADIQTSGWGFLVRGIEAESGQLHLQHCKVAEATSRSTCNGYITAAKLSGLILHSRAAVMRRTQVSQQALHSALSIVCQQ